MKTLLTLSEQRLGGSSGEIVIQYGGHPANDPQSLTLITTMEANTSDDSMSSQFVKFSGGFDLSEQGVKGLHAVLGGWLELLESYRKERAE